MSGVDDAKANTERASTPASSNSDLAAETSLVDVESRGKEREGSDLVDVLYEVRLLQEGKSDRDYFQDKPFKGLKAREDPVAENQICVIAVVRDVYGRGNSLREGEERDDFYKNRGALDEIVFGRDFVTDDVRLPFIRIESPALAALLRKKIQYYPNQTLTGKNIEVHYPYEALFHYYDDLVAVRDSQPSAITDTPDGKDESADNEAATIYDVKVLLNELEPRYLKRIRPELDLIRAGMVRWTYLWLLLKPGIDVYAKIEDRLASYVVVSCEELTGSEQADDRETRVDRWEVVLWNLQYFGKNIHRRTERIKIPKFKGERDILQLNVFPCEEFDKKDKGVHRKYLEERGRKYFSIIQRTPAHLEHSGFTLDTGSRRYNGEVIIDPREYLNFHLDRHSANEEQDEDAPADKIPQDFGGGVKFEGYDDLDPRSISPDQFTAHQCFLFSHKLLGFALKTKTWSAFDVDNVSEIDWPPRAECLNSLVLNNRDLEFIRAVSAHFMTRPRHETPNVSSTNDRKWQPYAADTIQGKGEGQIFLLHGPPGSGKTFTVECLAKYTRRPLLSLTVGDIGNVEDRMESALALWFGRAENWSAVLLLDEADVFLERRQLADLKRNSLVSVFLRTMEYYSGMLFLTTNRMNQIDDAFVSRIQVALKYKKLDNSARAKIWNQYFDRIEEERDDIEISEEVKIYVEENEKLKELEWNGREIRNALQTAINLARYDAVKRIGSFTEDTLNAPLPKIIVREKHFAQIVDMRRKFIDDKNSLDGKTDAIRAMELGDRMDDDAKLPHRRRG